MKRISEYDLTFFGILAVGIMAVGLFNLHYKLIYIPTGSMAPTIPKESLILCTYQNTNFKHGDIVIFKSENGKDYCKRIIGIPGDKLTLKDNKVYINNKEVKEEYVKEECLYKPTEITIPQKSYWVMGDNRNNSSDSREFGLVQENVIWGKKIV